MSRKQVFFWLAVVAAFCGGMGALYAADGCAACGQSCGGSCGQACGGSCGQACGCTTPCTQTVLVPEWATETRKCKSIECSSEIRERKITVFRCVPETVTVPHECTVMVPETRTRTETYTVQMPTSHQETQQYQVCVPTFRDVVHTYTVQVPIWGHKEETYTVMVPHQETRTATRQVVRCVPVNETRTVCVDRGHYEQARTCGYSCGSACSGSSCGGSCAGGSCAGGSCAGGSCGGSCGGSACCNSCASLAWVPKIVQESVPVTVQKPQTFDEQYQFNVTVCSPEARSRMVPICTFQTEPRSYTERVCDTRTETRTRTFTVCGFTPEQRTREVQFCVDVPQKKTWTEQVTNYRNVPEEKTEQFTVLVPHEVEHDVCVQVCHMVPKEVPVASCCSCDRGCRGCRSRCCGY